MRRLTKKPQVFWVKKILTLIIDRGTLVPLDEKTILKSAKKTGGVIVVDEGHQNFGVTAEIASRISEKAFIIWMPRLSE